MLTAIGDLTGWEMFVYGFVIFTGVAHAIFTIVTTVGGIIDLRFLFKELAKEPDELHTEKS